MERLARRGWRPKERRNALRHHAADGRTRHGFQALREALSRKEFYDMTAQLSQDYAPLLVSRHHDEEGHHDDR